MPLLFRWVRPCGRSPSNKRKETTRADPAHKLVMLHQPQWAGSKWNRNDPHCDDSHGSTSKTRGDTSGARNLPTQKHQHWVKEWRAVDVRGRRPTHRVAPQRDVGAEKCFRHRRQSHWHRRSYPRGSTELSMAKGPSEVRTFVSRGAHNVRDTHTRQTRRWRTSPCVPSSWDTSGGWPPGSVEHLASQHAKWGWATPYAAHKFLGRHDRARPIEGLLDVNLVCYRRCRRTSECHSSCRNETRNE